MPGSLFAFIYTFSGEVIEHERSIYTFMDLIGDLGGVNDLIVLFVSIFMGSISQISFFTKIMGKLYLVKSTEHNIFSNPTNIFRKNVKKLKYKTTKLHIPDSLNNNKTIQNVNKHYPIKFSTWTKIKLLFIPECLL